MQFGLSFDKIVALVTQQYLLGHRTAYRRRGVGERGAVADRRAGRRSGFRRFSVVRRDGRPRNAGADARRERYGQQLDFQLRRGRGSDQAPDDQIPRRAFQVRSGAAAYARHGRRQELFEEYLQDRHHLLCRAGRRIPRQAYGQGALRLRAAGRHQHGRRPDRVRGGRECGRDARSVAGRQGRRGAAGRHRSGRGDGVDADRRGYVQAGEQCAFDHFGKTFYGIFRRTGPYDP